MSPCSCKTRYHLTLASASENRLTILCNAAFTQCQLWLMFEIRQRYYTKSETVGQLFSVIWNFLSLPGRSSIRL